MRSSTKKSLRNSIIVTIVIAIFVTAAALLIHYGNNFLDKGVEEIKNNNIDNYMKNKNYQQGYFMLISGWVIIGIVFGSMITIQSFAREEDQ
jgi:hypothetical protein